MRRWVTVGVIGTGVAQDPRRPDLKGVQGLGGYAVAADNGSEMLVLVRRTQGPLDTLKGKAGVRYLGDEATGKERELTSKLRKALGAEAKRLGCGNEWQPEGYDVGG